MSEGRILFLHAADEGIFNAQASNVKKILARWPADGPRAAAFHFRAPDPVVAGNTAVKLIKLPTNRTWLAHALLHLQRRWAGIFAPGLHIWLDAYGLRLRRVTRRAVPIVTSYEGLLAPAGDGGALASEYGAAAGHPVHCQVVSDAIFRRRQWMHREGRRIVAISPFLERMAALHHPAAKVTCIPLGLDRGLYQAAAARHRDTVTPTVVGVGSANAHKRPEVFLELARRYPEARFIWYGEGPSRALVLEAARSEGIANLHMPGAAQPAEVAEAYAGADVFALPSLAEGVPKVTQEAATAGLPIVIFNHYEAPTVEDGRNGFQVADDADFIARIGQLLDDAELRHKMGRESRTLSAGWDWDAIAPRWAAAITDAI